MMTILSLIALGLLLLFGLTVFRGAPYVPAHKRSIEIALDLLNLQPGDLVVDLGSGDGSILIAAAKRGLRAQGYEINLLLCLITWFRARRFDGRVRVLWRDLWPAQLPANTKGIFIFSGGPFMKRLARKLEAEATRLQKPLRVVSYGFALPGYKPQKSHSGMQLFIVKPLNQ
jgi:precorrin-6B methylase 2